MRHNIKLNQRLFSAALMMAVFLAAVSLNAQNNSIKDLTPNKYALENLLAGIKSDNEGVKRSCIYFAGKYKIVETENALINQLKEEKNPSTRILIALVLYELGSVEGLLAVKDLAFNDDDAKVRRMSTHIYNEFLINDIEISLLLKK